MPDLNIPVTLTKRDIHILRENSLERVLTNLLPLLEKRAATNSRYYDAFTDLRELADTVNSLWYAASNEALVYVDPSD